MLFAGLDCEECASGVYVNNCTRNCTCDAQFCDDGVLGTGVCTFPQSKEALLNSTTGIGLLILLILICVILFLCLLIIFKRRSKKLESLLQEAIESDKFESSGGEGSAEETGASEMSKSIISDASEVAEEAQVVDARAALSAGEKLELLRKRREAEEHTLGAGRRAMHVDQAAKLGRERRAAAERAAAERKRVEEGQVPSVLDKLRAKRDAEARKKREARKHAQVWPLWMVLSVCRVSQLPCGDV